MDLGALSIWDDAVVDHARFRGAAWIGRKTRLLAAGLALLVLVQSARGLPRLFELTQTRDTDMQATGEWIREDYAEREPGFSRPLQMGIRLAPAHYAEANSSICRGPKRSERSGSSPPSRPTTSCFVRRIEARSSTARNGSTRESAVRAPSP